jgi:hypothetical protein
MIDGLLEEASKVFANERLRGITASKAPDTDAKGATIEWLPLTKDHPVIQSIFTAWKEFSAALASVNATKSAANESISLGDDFFNIDAKAMLSHREASILLGERAKVMVKAIGRARSLCTYQEAQAKAMAVATDEGMQETAHRLQVHLRIVRTKLKAGKDMIAAKGLNARLVKVQNALVQFPQAKIAFFEAKKQKQQLECDLEMEEQHDEK